MSRLLVHIATGPENPTRAALGLLVAKTALAAGHDVDLFFAGDGVGILRPETLDVGQASALGAFATISMLWSPVERPSSPRGCRARPAVWGRMRSAICR